MESLHSLATYIHKEPHFGLKFIIHVLKPYNLKTLLLFLRKVSGRLLYKEITNPLTLLKCKIIITKQKHIFHNRGRQKTEK